MLPVPSPTSSLLSPLPVPSHTNQLESNVMAEVEELQTYAALLLNGLSELLTISSMPSGDEMGKDKARARFQAKIIMSVEYCMFAGRGIRLAV